MRRTGRHCPSNRSHTNPANVRGQSTSQVALSGEVGQANYAASKAGLIGFARSLAREFGPRGITSNVVSPGLTETDMTAALPRQRRDEILRQVPLGRIARPEEAAAAVAFVVGDDAGYVTGAVIPVDGGAGPGPWTTLVACQAMGGEHCARKAA